MSYTCKEPSCALTFNTEHSLKTHTNRTHGENAPWRTRGGLKCPMCPVQFTTKVGMIGHFKRVHKMVNSSLLPSNADWKSYHISPLKSDQRVDKRSKAYKRLAATASIGKPLPAFFEPRRLELTEPPPQQLVSLHEAIELLRADIGGMQRALTVLEGLASR